MKKCKKGDSVYRVIWIDLPTETYEKPFIREYKITKLGPQRVELREVYAGKAAGQLGKSESGDVRLLQHYSDTPREAYEAAVRNAEMTMRAHQRAIENNLRRKVALEAIEPLPSKPAAPGEHYWLSKTQRMAHFPNLDDAYTSCLWCGTVKRADGLNKPCPGIIGIRLRADGIPPPTR